ncbi:hypothetical protein LU699_18065 [Luteimonas fraxinea]|uniref:hypothetical protein n=1 Tax=Luteimonas fraxinea TaxID=2901869 RepID=UPI001E5A615A|nr:hypothetical protein [Luteimonas fraxinea]UHH10131.1 hypothetical protein LU699_18065 [Luteimonas fraxinea]
MNPTPLESIEILKNRLASELEDRKWGFRQRELQYLEAGQHLRSLNQLMWQVPSIVIAITGGLWYGATTVEDPRARIAVLIFAAFFSLLAIRIIRRLRRLIQTQIDKQDQFSAETPNTAGPKNIVINCWTAALLGSAIVSLLGASHPSSLSKKLAPSKEADRSALRIEVVAKPALPRLCIAVPLVKPPTNALRKPPP